MSARWQISLLPANFSVKNVVHIWWQILRQFFLAKNDKKIFPQKKKPPHVSPTKPSNFITINFWDRFCTRIQNLGLRSWLLCTDPISGLRPGMGKKWPKNEFWPQGENGGKMGKLEQTCVKNRHLSIFWGPLLPHFPVGGQNPFFGHLFPISGRRPQTGSVPGNQDRKFRQQKDSRT